MAGTGKDKEKDNDINWELCFFCQSETIDKLTNPTSRGYDLVAKNLMQFYNYGELPFALNESMFKSEINLNNILNENNALWHKSCYLKCSTLKLERLKLRHNSMSTESNSEILANTRSRQPTNYNIETCIFCDISGTRFLPLSKVMKKSCNDNIIECAKVLKDYKILAKVSERCDLIALEAKYHHKCLCEYRNRMTSAQNIKSHSRYIKQQIESMTYAQLIAYINETRKTTENPTFKISDLAKRQTDAMKHLGVDSFVHSSRLKEKLLQDCPYLINLRSKTGEPSLITFRDNVDSLIRSLDTRDFDSEGKALCEVARIVRSDIFDKNKHNDNSQVPASLITLIKMMLYGSNSTKGFEDDSDGVSLRLAELIVFHANKHQRRGIVKIHRHTKENETSAPVFLAAKLYAETRQRKLLDCTYNLGLSISYHRLLSIITEKANEVCELYHKDNVVCPPKLKKALFTTAAVDNIDHNPTSTFSKTAFHGTAITLMQHKLPGETGLPRNLTLQSDGNSVAKQLPSDYTVVSPCFVDTKKCICPQSEIYSHDASTATQPLVIEKDWLESTMTDDFKPWAVHHAMIADNDVNKQHKTDIAILPLFKDQAHSPTMMLHSMNIVAKATKFLNPSQIPVIVADQPLYTLLKQLQYSFPSKVGEDKFFIMMGGLHIEMAALKVVGQWLNESGWVAALVQANVTTQGRGESMLMASNVTRTRYAHQVTAAALYSLQKKAYQAQIESANESQGPLITFEDWRLEKNTSIPQFKYWDLVLHLELLILQFVGFIRKGNYKGYLDSIRRLLPWFFALDHINYSRWLSVHLRDLANLEKIHPDLVKHFESGQFVARKTDRPFSAIALDQAHEQMNALLKGNGGMIGITENTDFLRKWLIAGPELADMIETYEKEILQTESMDVTSDCSRHHLDTAAVQKQFISDVKSLEATIQELGNPFLEETQELYNIDTKVVVSDEVVKIVSKIESFGEEQYLHFCKERLNGGKSLHDPIKLNKYPLFNSRSKKTNNKTRAKIGGLKNDCSLFSKLYIATCEHRTGNLDTFFAHENQASPPSLSVMGKIRLGTKSDLLKCLVNICDLVIEPIAPPVSVKVLDGPAVTHMLNPGGCTTFQNYADSVFIPFLQRELATVSRLDVIWDRYDTDSLKNVTRDKRGTGQRTRVTSNTKIPKGWANFLRDNSNKEEFFHFLALQCQETEFTAGKEFYITDGPTVLSNCARDKQAMEPCNHEEADTRIMVHIGDAVAQGHTKVMVRTVDTDVVVLAVSLITQLPQLEELWVHVGTGRNHQFLPCHAIATSIGPEKAEVLPLFHAFSGCDTVSSFAGKGKKSAFEAWRAYLAATEGFKLAKDGNVEEAYPILEKFVIALYDRSCTCTDINECRKVLFTKKDRQLENLPPTKDALTNHIKRSIYQGGCVWGQLLEPIQKLPCPADWGWAKNNGQWEPIWTTLPPAADACLELIRCRCKQKCAGRCNCLKRQIRCTDLCGCSGNC